MKVQFFSVNALHPDLDQKAVDQFCGSHRILSIDKKFVEQGCESFWSLCIRYLESTIEANAAPVKRSGHVDYKEVLSEKNFEVYSELRALRKTIAEAEGVPVYALFTNAQLAAMVEKSVVSLTQMGEIDGVGQSKLDKYGEQFLGNLTQLVSSDNSNEKA